METVLISGATSGIGLATARRLADGGYRVLAGYREDADRERLESEDSGRVGALQPVELDVSDAGLIDAALAVAKEATDGDGLVAIVNNAGIPVTGPLEVLPLDQLRRELEVNFVGQIAVTQAFLPMLRASKGRILFMSSIGGQVVFPFAGAYHASKHALEAGAEALRMELEGTGVDVVSIEPGITDALIWEKALKQARETMASLEPPQRNLYESDMRRLEERLAKTRDGDNMDAEKVAEQVENALTATNPPTRMPVGAAAKIAYRLRPIIPDSVWDRFARRLISG